MEGLPSGLAGAVGQYVAAHADSPESAVAVATLSSAIAKGDATVVKLVRARPAQQLRAAITAALLRH
jgi:hypothetical protein